MSELDDHITTSVVKTSEGDTRISAQIHLNCLMMLSKDTVSPVCITIAEDRLKATIRDKVINIVLNHLNHPIDTGEVGAFKIVGVREIKDNTLFVSMKYVDNMYNIHRYIQDLEIENKELKKLLGIN